MTKLNQGEKFPNLQFDTADKQGLQVYDILKGKTVFWVLRYIGCPTCRLDVHQLAQRYTEIQDAGAQIYVVMQSDPEHIHKDLAKTNTVLPFEIICDPKQIFYSTLSVEPAKSTLKLAGSGIMKLLKRGKEARQAGFSHGDYEGNELQLPACFIVGEDGTAEYVHYARNIADMPTIDELLGILKK
ncbi:MAG: redoxin domain-containing protein [Solobacterium sp.]|nr:redoxin domain-containing protein [Solobacterium sp.]